MNITTCNCCGWIVPTDKAISLVLEQESYCPDCHDYILDIE